MQLGGNLACNFSSAPSNSDTRVTNWACNCLFLTDSYYDVIIRNGEFRNTHTVIKASQTLRTREGEEEASAAGAEDRSWLRPEEDGPLHLAAIGVLRQGRAGVAFADSHTLEHDSAALGPIRIINNGKKENRRHTAHFVLHELTTVLLKDIRGDGKREINESQELLFQLI